MSFNLEIISPQQIVLNQDVDLVIFPGVEGDFGILKNHMPFLTYLRLGLLYIYKDKKLIQSFIINGGIVEISDNKCSLLTEDITDSKDFKIKDKEDRIERLKSKLVSKFYYA